MKEICVITKNPHTYFVKKLTSFVGKVNICFFNPWQDLVLPDAHFYFVRTSGVDDFFDQDLTLIKSIENKKVINPYESLKVFRDKLTQFNFFQKHKIPTPVTYQLDYAHLLDFNEFLIKPIRGQGGWGIQKLNKDNFHLWYNEQERKNDLNYLIQPYIDADKEIRVFFIGTDFKIVLKREATQGVASNFRQQGSACLDVLPQGLEDVVNKLISVSGAKYGAIDILLKDNVPYVLELNTVPGIEQLEVVSGLDIIRKLYNSLT